MRISEQVIRQAYADWPPGLAPNRIYVTSEGLKRLREELDWQLRYDAQPNVVDVAEFLGIEVVVVDDDTAVVAFTPEE